MCPPLNIDQLIKASTSPEFLKAAREQKKAMEEATKIFQQQLKPFIEGMDEFVRPMRKFIEDNSQQWNSLFKGMSEAFEQHRHFEDALKRTHIADKVSMPPYVLGMYSDEVMGLFQDSARSPIEAYEEIFSSEKHFESILAKWAENPIYEERIEILRAALAAHQRKEFILAIPTMLAQIDGILQASLSVDKHSKFGRRLKEKFAPSGDVKRFEDEVYGKKVFLEAIVDEIFEDSKKTQGIYPNRHAILHGNDLSYYKDNSASLRCVLILDFLSPVERDPLQ